MEARQPVQVGVDLRPIPIRMTEDEVWYFNADPEKKFFSDIQQIGKRMQVEDDTKWDAVDEMRDALAAQILETAERKEFLKRNYGLAALSGIAKAYAETVVAVPTESSRPSGKAQGTRGVSK